MCVDNYVVCRFDPRVNKENIYFKSVFNHLNDMKPQSVMLLSLVAICVSVFYERFCLNVFACPFLCIRGVKRLHYQQSRTYKLHCHCLSQRLKQLTKRQVDLNFEQLVQRYQAKQKEQEEKAFKAKYALRLSDLSLHLLEMYSE